jgi:hypothetical protein
MAYAIIAGPLGQCEHDKDVSNERLHVLLLHGTVALQQVRCRDG